MWGLDVNSTSKLVITNFTSQICINGEKMFFLLFFIIAAVPTMDHANFALVASVSEILETQTLAKQCITRQAAQASNSFPNILSDYSL